MRTIDLMLATLCLLACYAPACEARDVQMITTDWAPFYGAELDDNGVVTVVTKEAFKRAGHNASIRFVPWRRAMKLVELGEYDVLMGAYYVDDRVEHFIYSDPMFDITVGLVALKSLGVSHYESLRDLSRYRIGVSGGWSNGASFDEADFLIKEEASNQILNVRKLFRHRVDMIVISFAAFRYEARAMHPDKLEDVVFVQPPLMNTPLYLMVSRNIADGQQLIDDFNRGLRQLKEEGRYAEILARFGYNTF